MFDQKKFFDGVRHGPFPGMLRGDQVKGLLGLLGAWKKIADPRADWMACSMGNVYWETGGKMIPVREGFADSDEAAIRHVTKLFNYGRIRTNYALPHPKTGQSYYGRGQIQLTWYDNYKYQGDKLGVDLVNNPDLALNPDISSEIAVRGMLDGDFRKGHSLKRYFTNEGQDWMGSRAIVNHPSDHPAEIAQISKAFYVDILGALTEGEPDAGEVPGVPDGVEFDPATLGLETWQVELLGWAKEQNLSPHILLERKEK